MLQSVTPTDVAFKNAWKKQTFPWMELVTMVGP